MTAYMGTNQLAIITGKVLDYLKKHKEEESAGNTIHALWRLCYLQDTNRELLAALEELFNLLEDHQGEANWYLVQHYRNAISAIAKARAKTQ